MTNFNWFTICLDNTNASERKLQYKKRITWSKSPIHIINIPSIHNMSNVEKNSLWYNHDNICAFGQTELLRRQLLGITSTSSLCSQ
tara:strand:+ start:198 stop:455 length:258 start_codon:yes stop_codon:yes gene_type:complete